MNLKMNLQWFLFELRSEILQWNTLEFTVKTWAGEKVYGAIWEKDIILEIRKMKKEQFFE